MIVEISLRNGETLLIKTENIDLINKLWKDMNIIELQNSRGQIITVDTSQFVYTREGWTPKGVVSVKSEEPRSFLNFIKKK